ncbi:MAG: flagellar basal body P-ring protein FlgI [Verrucomicrobiota bacterium]|nr:flagellar basal body P-ring protein FlgI [Verrucomicrobiota bacterium]
MKRSIFLSLAMIFMPGLWAGAPAPGPGGVATPAPLPPVITGVRIKDLASVGGARFNQLTGYGLVFGLNNTGDKDPNYTTQAIANLLQRYGLKVDASKVKSKNAAAVMITALIPPFAKSGSRIDVVISALGDATTLTGGTLVQTPLIGGDNRVYAVAQGPVSNNSLAAAGNAAGVTKNHPTAGQIVGGAIVEREIPVTMVRDNAIDLTLSEADFTVATRMAAEINKHVIAKNRLIARATDGRTVRVEIPELYQGAPVDFIAQLEAIEVMPDLKARVVLNERMGTIVATAPVKVSSCAITQGNILIQITEAAQVSQPPAAAGAGAVTTTVPRSTVTVTEEGGPQRRLVPFRDMPSVQHVATSLNALGVSPRDMMAIFQALKQAGALQAELLIK